MKALKLTVPLGRQETPVSYTSRLAARNGLSARDFCNDWQLRLQSVVDGNADAIGTIARLGGVDHSDLMANAFIRGDKRTYRHRGEHLTLFTLRRRRVHVCPACFSDDIQNNPKLSSKLAVFSRAPWLIDAIKTCSVHNLELVQIAFDLPPRSLHEWVLAVEPSIMRLDRLAKQASQRRPSGLEAYVAARLDGVRQTPFLDSLELHCAIRTCSIIGAVEISGRMVNLKNLSDQDWWTAGAAGFQIAAGGPTKIDEFLRRLQDTYQGRSGGDGPASQFGRFYEWLAFRAKHPAYDPVRDLVGQHIRDNLPVGPADIIFGSPVTERLRHSIWTLSRETGLHPKRLRKLLRASGIIDDHQMLRPDHSVVFDAKAAESVIGPAQGALSLPAVGRYLNAPIGQVRLLAMKKFIQPCMRASAFSAIDRYAQRDLDEFLRRLLDGARAVGKPKPNQTSIPASAKRACCSVADIIHLILDRKLLWVGQTNGQRGYLSVRVDIDEIRVKVRGADHGGLTLRQTARMLESSDMVIASLVVGRHLKTRLVANPINKCRQMIVEPEEVARFQKEFVSLFGLAKERRRLIWILKEELDAAGVKPAFDPEKIGATFYARAEL
jgi:hypothetical protein